MRRCSNCRGSRSRVRAAAQHVLRTCRRWARRAHVGAPTDRWRARGHTQVRRPARRPQHSRSNPVIGSGGKRLERAAEGGERVAVCAVRDSEHNALEAATPLQRVKHITPRPAGGCQTHRIPRPPVRPSSSRRHAPQPARSACVVQRPAHTPHHAAAWRGGGGYSRWGQQL